MAGKSKYFRHHLIVPEHDTVVEEWIRAQQNVSASIRVLIKWCIMQRGTDDITCSADMGANVFGISTVRDETICNNQAKSEASDEAVHDESEPEMSQAVTNKVTDETTNDIAQDIMQSLLD